MLGHEVGSVFELGAKRRDAGFGGHVHGPHRVHGRQRSAALGVAQAPKLPPHVPVQG